MKPQSESLFSKASSYDTSNCISKLFLSFVYPLFFRGVQQNGLELADLEQCPASDEADIVSRLIAKNWEIELVNEKKPNFARAFFRSYLPYGVIPTIALLVSECILKPTVSLILGQLILYFQSDLLDISISRQMAWIYVAILILTMILRVVFDHPLMHHCNKLAMNQRTAICSLIYAKSLRLSTASVSQETVGQVINLVSNETYRLDDFAYASLYLIISPIQAAIILYIVWRSLGNATIAGTVVLLLFMPFQGYMGKLFSLRRKKSSILTDLRLNFLSELIEGIRIIRMYVWDVPFGMRISQARNEELKQIRKTSYLQAVNASIYFVSSRLIQFVCFTTFVLLGNTLTPHTVFVCMSLFNTLRINMTLLFPQAIQIGSELLVIFKRVEAFLLLEEAKIAEKKEVLANEDAYLRVQGISASWNKKQARPTLSNISFDLVPGELLFVIGHVGCSKTSLFHAILKELPLSSGSIDMKGKVAYAAQEAWTFTDTVRENIVFGSEFNAIRYRRVCHVCALEDDFKTMPLGDQTVLSDNLSGGQKARINLARAVYQEADIYLLDDSLSALDASVAKDVFDKCIRKFLRYKICIFVTHQMHFIDCATKILILSETAGMLAYGSPRTIREQLGYDYLKSQGLLEAPPAGSMSPRASICGSFKNFGRSVRRQSTMIDVLEDVFVAEDVDPNENLEKEEIRKGKSIDTKVYLAYIKAGAGPCLLLFMTFWTLLSQTLLHGSDYFLSKWVGGDCNENTTRIFGMLLCDQQQSIHLYCFIMVALFISTVLRSVSFYAICMRASKSLHHSIFEKILRAPVQFFDENSDGKIINRFSRDIRVVDELLPSILFDITIKFGQIIGVVTIVSLLNWYLLLPAIILAAISIGIRKIYLKSALDIRRYESLSRTPIYAHLGCTFQGLVTIRSFHATERFRHRFSGFLNDHTSTWFLFLSTSRALGMVIEICSTTYISIITISVMLTPGMDGAIAGLAINSGLLLAAITQMAVRQTAELENILTSVERIVEYQNLEQEGAMSPVKEATSKPGDKWPESGAIEFDNLTLEYANKKKVLKGLTLQVRSGEKVGIVGRTGAGKSSIIVALFRMTEPTEGAIRIDKFNSQEIELSLLRSSISIIPQQPLIFTGNVRFNLDPFGRCSDEQLWSALEDVQLKNAVEGFPGKLEANLTDSETTFSLGQRQLICLARVILHKSRVLVLDEATSNVDAPLEKLIQRILKEKFSNHTVLTIAHRLQTIVESDRILVLDAGELKQFDTPYKLLQDKDGIFYDMCKKNGPSMFCQLNRLAKKASGIKEEDEEQELDNSKNKTKM